MMLFTLVLYFTLIMSKILILHSAKMPSQQAMHDGELQLDRCFNLSDHDIDSRVKL